MIGDKIKDDVVGRWPGVFGSLGIEVGDGTHGPCPICRSGKDRFRMDDKNGTGSFYCSVCGAGDGWSLIQKVLGIDFKEALKTVSGIIGSVSPDTKLKEKPFSTPEQLRELFNGSKIVTQGDPVHRYLTGRKLKKIPQMLRYHPALWESETHINQKSMLAVVMNSENMAVTMHRTFIDADGVKLKIKYCKKTLPCLKGKTISGSACRLFPLDGRKTLGIAEGIETAIAAAQYFDIPTWATISAGGMESFIPPTGIECLTIFGDNDKSFAGQKAAYVMANKAAVNFKIPEINIHIPDLPGTDWADFVYRLK